MVRAGNSDEVLIVEPFLHQLAIRVAPLAFAGIAPHDQVDLARFERRDQLVHRSLAQRNPHVGAFLAKRAERAGQDRHPDQGGAADPQHRATAFLGGLDIRRDLTPFVEDDRRAPGEDHALRGDSRPVPPALEQPGVERGFQLLKHLGQRRLGPVHLSRDLADRAVPCKQLDQLQVAKAKVKELVRHGQTLHSKML